MVIKRICSLRNTKIAFIPIAPVGNYLLTRTYGILSDVKEYNRVFYRNAKRHNISVLPVYDGVNADDIILKEDGHHLNEEGNEVVYSAVVKYIDELI